MKEKLTAHARKFVSDAGLSLFVLLGAGWCIVSAQDNIRTSREGIVAKVGTAQIELAPVNSNTFWLAARQSGRPEFPKTSFLADSSRSAVRWHAIREQGFIGIQTEAGELLIDPQTGQWMLKSGNGRILISKGTFDGPTAGT